MIQLKSKRINSANGAARQILAFVILGLMHAAAFSQIIPLQWTVFRVGMTGLSALAPQDYMGAKCFPKLAVADGLRICEFEGSHNRFTIASHKIQGGVAAMAGEALLDQSQKLAMSMGSSVATYQIFDLGQFRGILFTMGESGAQASGIVFVDAAGNVIKALAKPTSNSTARAEESQRFFSGFSTQR